MSSRVTPKTGKKSRSTFNSKLWIPVLCGGVVLVAVLITLIRTGAFSGGGGKDIPGKYVLTHMTDPADGVEIPVEDLGTVMNAGGYGESLVSVELKEDGTFTLDSGFDMLISFAGTYEMDGKNITMTAQDDTSGTITGTVENGQLKITDAEGYKMTFQKVE